VKVDKERGNQWDDKLADQCRAPGEVTTARDSHEQSTKSNTHSNCARGSHHELRDFTNRELMGMGTGKGNWGRNGISAEYPKKVGNVGVSPQKRDPNHGGNGERDERGRTQLGEETPPGGVRPQQWGPQ